MAHLEIDFYSKILQKQTAMTVLLPEYPAGGKPLSETPVLTLLHGLSDDHHGWIRRTAIERYAEKYGLVIVMPETLRGFYVNVAIGGYRYWDHVAKEVPAITRHMFGLAERRELNHVAGLSMGGFGAMKHALLQPERFATAASFSGAVNLLLIPSSQESAHYFPGEGEMLFGSKEQLRDSDNDLLALLRRNHAAGVTLPNFYTWCGTEDELYPCTTSFRDQCRSLDIPLTYTEGPGFHRWEYWEVCIQNYLQWLADEHYL